MQPFSRHDSNHRIDGPAGAIELACSGPSLDGIAHGRHYLAVVCHPHPLHGGTMNNKVVTTLARGYRAFGCPTVRFNFRGVGGSEGQFDEGRGEVDDLKAVIAWAREQQPRCRQLLLAGFSFGSAVAAKASHDLDQLAHLTLAAPPVMRYDYDRQGRFPAPLCVIQGDQDEVLEATAVYRWLETLASPPALLRFPEATHFFHGHLTELKERFLATLARQLGLAEAADD